MSADRPTREEVDLALMLAYPGSQAGPNAATILGAEVRALRSELVGGESWRELLADQLRETRRTNSLLTDKNRVLESENARLRADLELFRAASEAAELRIVELRAELEVERMRLAACGVAANGAGAEHFATMLPEYDSDALRATRRLREDVDRERVARMTAEMDTEGYNHAIARVEALRDQWLQPSATGTANDADVQRYLCGDALRDALRGSR